MISRTVWIEPDQFPLSCSHRFHVDFLKHFKPVILVVISMVIDAIYLYSNIWFEAATVVAVAPPVALPAGDVLKSALAGGLASALSTSLMHPIDTIKVSPLGAFAS